MTRGPDQEAEGVEHRCDTRTCIGTVVEVRCRDRQALIGRMRNLSLGGMFVELGRTNLPLNLSVHLRFELEATGHRRPCLAEGILVHQGPGGCGVMFTAVDGDTLEVLGSVLHAATRPPAP